MKKLYLLGGLASLALSVACVASPVAAQSQNCAPRGVVVERLADKYGESRQSVGMINDQAVMEVFANEESGSWTITVTNINGISCLVTSGIGYESVNEPPSVSPDDGA